MPFPLTFLPFSFLPPPLVISHHLSVPAVESHHCIFVSLWLLALYSFRVLSNKLEKLTHAGPVRLFSIPSLCIFSAKLLMGNCSRIRAPSWVVTNVLSTEVTALPLSHLNVIIKVVSALLRPLEFHLHTYAGVFVCVYCCSHIMIHIYTLHITIFLIETSS